MPLWGCRQFQSKIMLSHLAKTSFTKVYGLSVGRNRSSGVSMLCTGVVFWRQNHTTRNTYATFVPRRENAIRILLCGHHLGKARTWHAYCVFVPRVHLERQVRHFQALAPATLSLRKKAADPQQQHLTSAHI